MVMRLGQGVGFVYLCVYVCWAGGGGDSVHICGWTQHRKFGKHTDQCANTPLTIGTGHACKHRHVY